MKVIKKWLMADEQNTMRRAALWNTIASAEYSLQSAVLLLVVTRVGGLTEAGTFTIAYTVAQMMATIGSYAMRDYQASDVSGKYKFSTYWTSRMITIVVMLISCMGYAVLGKYAVQQIILIGIFSIYRTVDDIEDVLQGEMQRKYRLDVAAKIMAARIFIATLLFTIVYAATKNLFLATATFAVTAIIAEVILNAPVLEYFSEIQFRLNREGVAALLVTCFPLCAGGFLYNYLVNASKYAINRNMPEMYQTVFGILFMPIFVINMLSVFIYKPMVAEMGRLWSEGEKRNFFKIVIKQMFIIVGLTAIVVLGGYVIGLDILGWIYGVDLAEYRGLFAILLCFGGIAAMDAYFVLILTIMRRQKVVIVAYGVAAGLNMVMADRLVNTYGLSGAGAVYGITMSVVLLLLGMFMLLGKGRRQ